MQLFDPIKIRGVEIPNRIVMPAMTTRLAGPDGAVTPELIRYYLARAEGGAGLITVEMGSPDAAGRHRARELGIFHDGFLPGLCELTTQLKAAGARTSVQIGHAGGHTRQDVTGLPPVAPSALAHVVQEGDTRTVVPQALSRDGIRAVVQAFAEAAERAKQAGFDLAEIHGAHGYLIAQFLSPLDNHRADEYGGGLESRARFAIEVVQACRERVGDFPLIFRLSADEYAPGGVTLVEAERVSRWLVEAGVDALHISAGCYRSLPSGAIMIPPMGYPEGVFLHLSHTIKASVAVPIIAVGRLHDPALAERVIVEGQADMVALGRQLIADPEWPRKTLEGRSDEIRPCLSCNTCVDGMRDGNQIQCLVNPEAGRERHSRSTPTDRPRSVLVVGGGPAGMVAARVLALRGHRVVLCEQSDRLGGQLRLAAKAPVFQNVETNATVLERFVEYLARQLDKAGVEVWLGQPIIPDLVEHLKPDVVLLATGASYRFPFHWILPRLLDSSWASSHLAMGLIKKAAVRRLFYYGVRKPNDRSYTWLRRSGREVRKIGDCSRLGKTMEAVADAVEVASAL